MKNVVEEAITELIKEGTLNIDKKNVDEEMRLLGSSSSIDSLDLVQIVVKTEKKVENRYGVSITIANEDAMSKTKSPFISVSTLSEYVDELVEASNREVEASNHE